MISGGFAAMPRWIVLQMDTGYSHTGYVLAAKACFFFPVLWHVKGCAKLLDVTNFRGNCDYRILRHNGKTPTSFHGKKATAV